VTDGPIRHRIARDQPRRPNGSSVRHRGQSGNHGGVETPGDKTPQPFEMTIDDVFTVVGRGVVVLGSFVGPLPHTGDRLILTGGDEVTEAVTCRGILNGRTDGGGHLPGIFLGEIDRSTVRAGLLLTVAS
jgi:translation elongation factor EF-Tu-like GTPase